MLLCSLTYPRHLTLDFCEAILIDGWITSTFLERNLSDKRFASRPSLGTYFISDLDYLGDGQSKPGHSQDPIVLWYVLSLTFFLSFVRKSDFPCVEKVCTKVQSHARLPQIQEQVNSPDEGHSKPLKFKILKIQNKSMCYRCNPQPNVNIANYKVITIFSKTVKLTKQLIVSLRAGQEVKICSAASTPDPKSLCGMCCPCLLLSSVKIHTSPII